jgi:hypothetical protein
MKIKHKLYTGTDGEAHIAFIVVDLEKVRADEPMPLLQMLAEEPDSGFTKLDEGVYLQRYL